MQIRQEFIFLDIAAEKGYLNADTVDYIKHYMTEKRQRGKEPDITDFFVLAARAQQEFQLGFAQIAELKALAQKKAKELEARQQENQNLEQTIIGNDMQQTIQDNYKSATQQSIENFESAIRQPLIDIPDMQQTITEDFESAIQPPDSDMQQTITEDFASAAGNSNLQQTIVSSSEMQQTLAGETDLSPPREKSYEEIMSSDFAAQMLSSAQRKKLDKELPSTINMSESQKDNVRRESRESFIPGQTFAHYRIEKILGKGGMGIVYKVFDSKLNRTAALKLLLSTSVKEIEIKRFLREARSLAQLSHSNIIGIYDVGESPEPHFTMEYIEGDELSDLIRKKKVKPLQAAKIIKKVADALHVVHQKGIIHRDIKPSNIMVAKDGAPKLMDFGLAKSEDTQLSRTGEILGTPAYMPPEQVNKEQVDLKSDIYSLGATLYQALVGREPFQGDTLYNMIFQICHKDPVPPRMLNPDISPDLEAITLKALEKKPDHRYSSARLFARDLQNFIEHRPVMAKPATRFSLFKKWVLRNKLLCSIILFFILVIISGASFFFWKQEVAKQDLAKALDRAKNSQKTVEKALKIVRKSERNARAEKEETRRQKDNVEKEKEKAEQQRKKAVEEEKKAKNNLYYASVNLADKYRQEHNSELARRLLDECPKYLRGWEWHWISRQLNTSSYRVAVGLANKRHCVYHPAGKLIAMARPNVVIWNVRKKKPVSIFMKHKGEAVSCDFGPLEKNILSADSKKMYLWNAKNGKILKTFPGYRDDIQWCAYSADGKYVASAGRNHLLRIWDVKKGKSRTFDLKVPVDYCRFHPKNSNIILCAGGDSRDYRLYLFDIAKRKKIKESVRYYSRIGCCEFSPDGETIVFSSDDNNVRVWQWKTDKILHLLRGHNNDATSCTYSPDNRLIASASRDTGIKIWDAKNGRLLETLLGFNRSIFSCAFSPDGQKLVAVGDSNQMVFWHTPEIWRPYTNKLRSCSFDSQGKLMAVGGDANLDIWNSQTGKLRTKFRMAVMCLSNVFLRDGNRIVSTEWRSPKLSRLISSSPVKISDILTGKTIKNLHGHSTKKQVGASAISPDGRWLATAGHDKNIILWDMTQGERKVHQWQGNLQAIKTLGFSSDSKFLASGGDDNIIKVWNIPSGQLWKTLHGHDGNVLSCVFIPGAGVDKKYFLASAAEDFTAKIWNVETKQSITLKGHRGYVRDCDFTPDSSRLMTVSDDATIKIWDAAAAVAALNKKEQIDLKPILSLRGHSEKISACAFSPDGTKFISVGEDALLKIWYLNGFKEQ